MTIPSDHFSSRISQHIQNQIEAATKPDKPESAAEAGNTTFVAPARREGPLTVGELAARFIVVTGLMQDRLKRVREEIKELNDKVETLSQDMQKASAIHNEMATDGKKRPVGDNNYEGKSAQDWIDQSGNMEDYTYIDASGEEQTIRNTLQPRDELQRKDFAHPNEGFKKDTWDNIANQCKTQIQTIETHVDRLSSDLKTEVQTWQTFSAQFTKAFETIAEMGRKTGSGGN